ncbi:MAG: MFS transporter [Rubrivivax sp.]
MGRRSVGRVPEQAQPVPAPGMPAGGSRLDFAVLRALVVGQLGVHAPMAGLRMAASLQALREGHGPWTVGLLLALFAAAAVLLALHSGRLADRHGYHRPVRLAVAMVALAGVLAVVSTFLDGWPHLGLLCVGAMLAGGGANMGMLAIQHTAGAEARDSTERVRVFSWLGVAPSFANVIGPVAAGFMIDLGGFAAAYALLATLPLLTLACARQVPQRAERAPVASVAHRPPWTLLRVPGVRRLLLVSWVISMGWDVHAFAVPVLGHERGLSASTIGLIVGAFTLSVTLVRLAIPAIAHRVREVTAVSASMVGTGLVFAVYPYAESAWAMGLLSALLGLTLGSSQPMVLSTLHHLTPEDRHGEALAFRSMTINLSSTAMPLVFGLAGTAVGPALLFWIVGATNGAGAWTAAGLQDPRKPGEPPGSR